MSPILCRKARRAQLREATATKRPEETKAPVGSVSGLLGVPLRVLSIN